MPNPAPARHTYPYPRPALTVDLIVATDGIPPEVLLIRRGRDPFAGLWALPGGFVDENEPLEAAARRELLEETGATVDAVEQLVTVGDPGRDPRGWTVSVVYLARVRKGDVSAAAGDDAAEVGWFRLDALPAMAFDHVRVLGVAGRRLIE